MYNNVVIFKTFKSRQDIKKAKCPEPIKGCNEHNLNVRSMKPKSHIDEKIFLDNTKKVFKNAIDKNTFTWSQVKDDNNYIMYMCSNSQYDYFKSKLTKTSYRVER